MASNTPDVRILVGNLGDASPSGESAALIRTNLEKALSAGIKIKITPDVSGATGSGGVSTITRTILNNANLKNAGVSELQRQYDALSKELNEYAQRSTDITALEKEQVKQRVAALSQLVSQYEKLDAAQLKTIREIDQARMQEQIRISVEGQDPGALKQMREYYSALEQEATEAANAEYQAYVEWNNLMRGVDQQNWMRNVGLDNNPELDALNQYYKELEKSSAKVQKDAISSNKTLASMRLKLSEFNQYLTTVNPKVFTEFADEINNVKTLLGSGLSENAQEATAAMNRLKAQIKDAGYEGGNAIAYINAKLKTFATYLVSSAMTMGFVSGVRTMIENVKDLDAALTDLRIVTGSTREETQELLETYNQMAQQLGTTTTSVSSGAVDWLRQGYSEEDARELLTQSMTLSIVGDMDSASATEALTAAMKGNHNTSLCVQKCA